MCNKSEELKPKRKNKFKYFLLAHILTLFFASGNFSFAADLPAEKAGSIFDFGQKNYYSEPFSKLIEFLNAKKKEIENYGEKSNSANLSARFTDVLTKRDGQAGSSFLSAVLGPINETIIGKPKQYFGKVFCAAKDFVFPGTCRDVADQKGEKVLSSRKDNLGAVEIDALKQQYEDAINEANVLNQKFNQLQNEISKVKAGGIVVKEPIIEQKTIERTIEKIISGLSQNDLDSGISSIRNELNNLNTNLLNKINNLSVQASDQTSAVYRAVSLTNKIDSLSGTRLSNITVSGVAGLTDADIPDGITASNYLLLAGGTLTGALAGTDLTLSGNLTVSGTQTLSGAITIPYFSATSTTQASTIDYRLGIGTTSPNWKLSVAGIGSFDDYVRASYFTATSTTASTFPYASTTALTVSGSAYLGSLNGPLQANSGLVSATTSVGYQYGGTGLTAAPSFGQILRGTGSGYSLAATSTLGINTSDLIEGSNLFWTDNRFDNRLSATTSLPNITTLANLATVGTITSGTWNGTTIGVSKGGTGQTSFGQGWLHSDGTTLTSSTSPTVNYITATSTTATSTFPLLKAATAFQMGSDYFTDITGTGLQISGNALTLNATGDWTGSFDGQEGTYYLARANHTGTQAVSTLSNYDWTFSSNYGTNNLTGSTTMPWWAQGGLNASSTSNFVYASTTALTVSGNSYLGTVSSGVWNGTAIANNYGGTGIDSSALTGLAQIVAGTWSASSTLSTAYGGTGWQNLQANTILLGNGVGRLATTTAGTDGFVLGLSAGVPTWLATSTLSTITGTLSVAKGGTGQTSFGQGWLNSDGTTISASTSPTVNYIVATSTTATSTFAGGISVAGTAGLTVLQNGNVGIGTVTPNAKLDVRGPSNTSLLELRPSSGDGTTDYNELRIYGQTTVTGSRYVAIRGVNAGATDINDMALWTSRSTTPIEVMRLTSLGNVGIGTTTPIFLADILSGTGNTGANVNNPSQLSVTGANKTLTGGGATVFINSNSAMAADTGGQITFTGRDTTSSTNSVQWGVIKGAKTNNTSANQDGYVALAVNTHSAALVEGMRLTASGSAVNVGIGTTTPLASLQISGGYATAPAFTNTAQLRIVGTGAGGTGNDAVIRFDTPSNSRLIYVDESDSNKLKFTGGAATDLVTFDNDGNVGIGTTSPYAKLSVVGETVSSYFTATSTTATSTFAGGMSVAGTAGLTVLQNGNVGIGTTGPVTKFQVAGGNIQLDNGQGVYFRIAGGVAATNNGMTGNDATDILTFRTAAIDRMTISSGNVGLGTTTPWRTLSVTGTVGFDGLTGATGAGSLCLDSSKQVVYNSASDACLSSTRATKHNIANLDLNGISLINQLQPFSFIYNQGDGRTRYGFMAEDTAVVDDRLATHNEKGEITGIDDRAIMSVAVKAIQELNLKVSDLQASAAASSGAGTDNLFSWILDKFKTTLGISFENGAVKANKICVGETCVTEEQFKAVFGASSASSVSSSSSSEEASPSGGLTATTTSSESSSFQSSSSDSSISSEASSSTASSTESSSVFSSSSSSEASLPTGQASSSSESSSISSESSSNSSSEESSSSSLSSSSG